MKRTPTGIKVYEKAKDNKKTILYLLKYIKKYKFKVLLAFILNILSNLLMLAGPLLIGYTIDLLEDKNNIDFNKLYLFCFIMIVFYILSGVFSYLLNALMSKISAKMVADIRMDLNEKMLDMSVSFFDKNSLGDILSRMCYDIDTIGISLTHDIVQVTSSIISILISFVMMFIISKKLMIIFVFSIPISIIFIYFITKKNRKYFMERSKKLGALNGYVEEMLTGFKTVKAYNLENIVFDDFEEYNQNARHATALAEIHGSRVGPSMNFINNLVLVAIAILGIFYLKDGIIGAGAITSFILYSKKFTGPINEIFNIYSDILSALAAGERVFSIFNNPNETDNGKELVNLEGNFKIQNLNFEYISNKPVLKDINLDIEKGKIIAIVGKTGCGKTTLINLLMRFYDINNNTIMADNYDVNDIKLDNYRLNYSMVLQDTWLFEGSFYDNISYGNKNVTLEQVKKACKDALIDDFIEKLPNGYDTIINDNAINISIGQRQQVVIARALLSESKILILDEATSNVDTLTEVKIQKAMTKLMHNKTCFIIAHRLSTIKNADKILVMKDGKIIESGKHKELLEKNGYYKEIYMSQFEIV